MFSIKKLGIDPTHYLDLHNKKREEIPSLVGSDPTIVDIDELLNNVIKEFNDKDISITEFPADIRKEVHKIGNQVDSAAMGQDKREFLRVLELWRNLILKTAEEIKAGASNCPGTHQ